MKFRYLLLLPALLCTPAAAAAQVDSTCSYDACSLQVQQRFLSTWIVRGVGSERVLKLGFSGAGLDAIVAASDSAVMSARRFRHHQTISSILGSCSAIAGVGAWLLSSDHEDFAVAATIAGVGLGFASGQERKVAANALERSLWWYNRTLQ